jgi:hypothetical protein
MLVVDARDIGLGRLLAVEPDVLDRALIGPKVMLFYFALAGDNGLLMGVDVEGLDCLWKWLDVERRTCAVGDGC